MGFASIVAFCYIFGGYEVRRKLVCRGVHSAASLVSHVALSIMLGLAGNIGWHLSSL